MNEIGKLVVGLGIVLILIGLIIQVPKVFSWVGRLPGDVRWGNTTILIGTSIAISLILTVVLNVLAALLRRR